jgi:integrase
MENELRIRRPVADALRLIALTGMRRGEVIGLKWQHVDLQRGQIKFPPREHKTGKRTGKPKVVLLPPQGVQILQRQPDGKAEEYVFRSTKEGAPITLTRDWHKVRAEAKLPEGMVLHELRHSIGSHLAMSGASAVEVMQALGHKQISTTQRYIHFAEQARSTLAQRAAAMATAGMAEAEGKEKAEVVPMPKKRKK